jgi:uncharacterized protein
MSMQPLRFDQNGLRVRLERLDQRQRGEFALGCAERLLPQYQRFHEQTAQGDPDTLTGALNAARNQLADATVRSIDLELLAKRCEELVPTEDESWTNLSGLAQNAAAAAAYALRSLASDSLDNAVWAAVQGYEAADLIVQDDLSVDFNEPGIEDRVVAESVVQQELSAQNECLQHLEKNRCR